MTFPPRPLLVALTLIAVLSLTSGFLFAIAPAPLTAADAQPASTNSAPSTLALASYTAPTQWASAQ